MSFWYTLLLSRVRRNKRCAQLHGKQCHDACNFDLTCLAYTVDQRQKAREVRWPHWHRRRCHGMGLSIHLLHMRETPYRDEPISPAWGSNAMTRAVLIWRARWRCTLACSLVFCRDTIWPPSLTKPFRNCRFLKSALCSTWWLVKVLMGVTILVWCRRLMVPPLLS